VLVRQCIRSVFILLMAGALVATTDPARAQSRPLVTEDPETVPAGSILLEGGLDFAQDAVYPVSGLTGNLWRVGTFGLSFGVSPIAEIQLDGGVRDRLGVKTAIVAPLSGMLTVDGDSTSDFEDLAIGAKVRFLRETATRPAMAVRFWTKLPNASNESGLGLDTTDFHFGFALAKTVQSVRVVGNFGFAILADPTRGDRQNDVIDFGGSVARAIAPGVEVVGELNGRINTRSGEPPPGTDSLATMRLGARLTRGPVRLDGALAIGVTERDPVWGFTTGVTWVFHAFDVN
jgi:Putative MetA-pathway of phenol degradation